MSLFTSSARATASVAYFLAIFVLLGGLASLHNHGDRAAMSRSDVHRSKAASARSIVQDNAEFFWDLARNRVDLFNYTSTESYYSFRPQKNLTGTNVFQDVSAPVL